MKWGTMFIQTKNFILHFAFFRQYEALTISLLKSWAARWVAYPSGGELRGPAARPAPGPRIGSSRHGTVGQRGACLGAKRAAQRHRPQTPRRSGSAPARPVSAETRRVEDSSLTLACCESRREKLRLV